MEAACYFETSTLIYKTTLYHIEHEGDIYIKADLLFISCLTTILQVYNLFFPYNQQHVSANTAIIGCLQE